jgi:hypothetical protein
MKYRYLILSAILFFACAAQAQNVVKGSVNEAGRSTKLSNVFVRDNQNRQMTITDTKGAFSIRTETGHILIFSSPGYVSDTLYVTDFTPKKIELVTETINLKQVNISAKRESFDAHKEYPEVYSRSKVYPLSPTSWFSKEARDARKLKKYFKREEEERHIDEVFNMNYVQSIIPLRGQELENFMTLYRPSYAFVTSNNGPSLAVYINDSYKKYQALPPDKRTLPELKE